jgi:hypothetical protein
MNWTVKHLVALGAAALLATLSPSAQADELQADDCAEGFAERVSLGLGFPPEPRTNDLPVLTACQVWPAHPGQAIFAIASPRDRGSPDGLGAYDLQVLLLEHAPPDAIQHRMPNILARFTQTAAFPIDSVHLSHLGIDTAGWQLAADVQAFGIRSTMNVRSSSQLHSEDWLRLYRREDALLLPVLDPLVVHRTTGAWDTRCAGQAMQLRRSVGMAHQGTKPYADIILTEAVSDISTLSQDGGDCEQRVVERSSARYVLSFTAEGYALPTTWTAP